MRGIRINCVLHTSWRLSSDDMNIDCVFDVVSKLDYIKGMGFDAIWISPIPVNTDGGYHGYWAQDIYQVNGTETKNNNQLSHDN